MGIMQRLRCANTDTTRIIPILAHLTDITGQTGSLTASLSAPVRG